jgi:hypothetical protein
MPMSPMSADTVEMVATDVAAMAAAKSAPPISFVVRLDELRKVIPSMV